MTGNNDAKIGGLLLAAGGSSRMGRPKQLLQFEGKTLLRRVAETIVNSTCDPVVVVLGAERERSEIEIADLAVSICINRNWQTGMSSSIKAGLSELLKIEPDLAAVVITLCDQPHVTSENIDLFTAEFRRSGAIIVAAEYDGTVGVPALFSLALFGELFDLKGDKGARNLIRTHTDKLIKIKLDEAAFDIDTYADLNQLISSK